MKYLVDVLTIGGGCAAVVGFGMTWGIWAGLGVFGGLLFTIGLAIAWRQAG